MTDILIYLLSIDNMTIFLVAVLATWGGYIVHQMVSSTIMTLLFVPGFVSGALISNYVFGKFGIILLADRDSNSLVITAIGMVSALFIIVGGIWLAYQLSDMNRPSIADRRGRDGHGA